MSLMLNAAILARLNGTETLTGDALAAQNITKTVPWHWGAVDDTVVMPCGSYFEDAGTESLNAADIGIVSNSVYRFQIWQHDTNRAASFIPQMADALEVLFDMRRGGPKIPIVGYGRTFWTDLFTPLQAPLHDDNINAFYGLMSFRIVESRP